MATKRESEGNSTGAKRTKRMSFTAATEFENKAIDTVRLLAVDMVAKANSGHPGAPMGCAPAAYVLWKQIMNYSPANPSWMNRDRFVLSNGHACALLYSMLHLTGYNVSMDDLKQFRQVDSITAGHPENILCPGVEVSTGPLGQGIANAVGIAIAEKHLAAEFNREGFDVLNHYTYVLCGDGCLQEGVSGEASSLAGHLGLGKLILIYDDNQITIDGETELSFTEDVLMRYEAYGWHTQAVETVNDINGLREAILVAQQVTDKPSIIKMKTIIGFGSLKQGKEEVHGAPLKPDDIRQVKEKFGFNPDESFVVPEDVAAHFGEMRQIGQDKEAAWNDLFSAYKAAHPDLAADFERRVSRTLPAGWKDALPRFTPDPKGAATRKRSGDMLNAIAPVVPELVGGSADLTPSNNTWLDCSSDFQKNTPNGRYFRFGVREHGMAAVMNGIFAHGMLRPYGGTFLNFIGYALGAVRLSALNQFGVIYVATHDSIGLGEDGPTHQPIEMLAALRATPNTLVLRPADGNETNGAYIVAMEHLHTPSVLALSRQNVPELEGTAPEKVALGAYVLREFKANESAPLDIVLMGSGTEVHLCVEVAQRLHSEGKNVRVVSIPCHELFDAQSLDYKLEVLPDHVPCVSVEALSTEGWDKYAHLPYGMTTFGVSGPGGKAMAKFGFTVDNLSNVARETMQFYAQHGPPRSRVLRPQVAVVKALH